MADQENQRNREAFLKDAEVFRRNALLMIKKVLELKRETKKDTTALVEEILHSIFFLAKISMPYFTPGDILKDLEHEMRAHFPKPFKHYSSQLPRRSPFSCVLDMIVRCTGQENEEEIKARVQEFILCVCSCAQLDKEESVDDFRMKAKIIIYNVLRENNQTPVLVNQVLHSIFFLGTMRNPPCTPEMILGEKAREMREHYPRPFQYSSENPIPCVLNKVALLIGQHNEERLMQLRRLAKKKKSPLLSSTICVSQAGENAARYYGVSMSSSDNISRRVMIAASCIGVWDEYVAGAVMSYFSDDNNEIKHKVENIDGTIKLPENVKCEAFSLKNGTATPPCKSCVTLFSLPNGSGREYIYGNCAEAESLSNLFQNDKRVKRVVELQNCQEWTFEKKEVAKEKVNKYLMKELKEVNFQWDGKFFSPTQKCCTLL